MVKHPDEIGIDAISFLPSQQKRNNIFPLRTLRLVYCCQDWFIVVKTFLIAVVNVA